MCGIFGYIGDKNAKEQILLGLKRLEYRGYDSWGVAVLSDEGNIEVHKTVGEIGNLKNIYALPDSNIGIGHTRWATHGGVNDTNAHPHFSTDGSFVVAQNGIVENYQQLREMLKKEGLEFQTETDTEVIVRLIELKIRNSKLNNLREAVREAFMELKGRNTIIILSKDPREVIAVRNGSPLVVGIVGEQKIDELYIASDTLSFADRTDKIVFVNNMEMIEYKDGQLSLRSVEDNKEFVYDVKTLDNTDVSVDHEGHEHFMIKEIIEQQHTVRDAVQYSQEELAPLVAKIKSSKLIYTIGAGTAGFAAGQIAYYLRKFAKLNVIELRPYEIDSFQEIFSPNDLMIVVSQSGETADTIEAIEIAKSHGVQIASIVNMLGSTITRISDYSFFSRSGPEICVASTKAFTAQISWGYLLARAVAGQYSRGIDEIYKLSDELAKYFSKDFLERIKFLAEKLIDVKNAFVLGKGQNFYPALESALKVKEISYKHFEGFSAGELKHGVIALIEKGTPVFVIQSDDKYKADIQSAAAQVKARGAYLIGIGDQNNELFDYFISTPKLKDTDAIANVIPFQLLAYYMCIELGQNPDKPRNLAKSVTVK